MANRETDYWSKVQSRDDLIKSCNNIGKNGTIGYDFGFISEGARCNYYDASGNLKSEWLDRVYHKSWIAVSTVASVIIAGLLGWGLYKFTGGVGKVSDLMQQEDLLQQGFEATETETLEQINTKITTETQDFLNNVYNAWVTLRGADKGALELFYENFKENFRAFKGSNDDSITKFRNLLDNGQACVNDENRPSWVYGSDADLYSQFAQAARVHLDKICGLFSKREEV